MQVMNKGLTIINSQYIITLTVKGDTLKCLPFRIKSKGEDIMKKRTTKFFALAISAAMIAGLTACGSESASTGNGTSTATSNETEVVSQATADGEVMSGEVVLTVINSSGVETLDPCHSNSMIEDDIFREVFDTLVQKDADLNIIPSVATSWENSEDGYSWTFHLRDDVYFHDGVHMTAHDVKFTFDRAMDPNTEMDGNYAYNLSFLNIAKIECPDDYTIVFTTESPCPGFLNCMDQFYIYSEAYYAGLSNEEASKKPLGSGPFIFDEWVMDQYVSLVRNNDYWDNENVSTNITKILFRPVSEASTRVSELMTADTSAGATVIDKIGTEYKEQLELSNLSFIQLASGTRQFIGLIQYHEDSILLNKTVRQALNHAVDFETIAATILNGFGTRTATMVAAPYNNPNLVPYDYNPDKAISLLAEAGYTDIDNDGVLEDANGNDLSLSIASPNGRYLKDSDICQAVADYITKVGIPTEVHTYEWSVFAGNLSALSLEEDMFLVGSGSDFSAQADLTDFYSGSQAGYTGWVNEEYDSLFEALGKEMDSAKATEISYQAQELFFDEAPIIFLYYPPLFYGATDNLEWTPLANGRMFFKDAIVHVSE